MNYHKTLLLGAFIVTAFFALVQAPRAAHAGCTCVPKANSYKEGHWVNDGTGGVCDKVNPALIECYKLNGIPNGIVTAEYAMKAISLLGTTCFDAGKTSTCNPLTEGSINVGFRVPTFAELIGNVIRLFFFVAGLVALVFLLLGGFEWVSSGGDSKKTDAARAKITSAVIGLVIMIAVLSLVIFLEQVVFGGKICLGISCPMNIGFMQLIR